MDLGNLFHSVAGLLNNETRRNDNVDTDGLLGRLGGLFRDHGYDGPDYRSQESGGYNGQPVLPASQDPLGDPADENQNILPASQDPLGDPADENQNILPASQDPLGDPADEPRRW